MASIVNCQLMTCQPPFEQPSVVQRDDSLMRTITPMATRITELIGRDSLPQAVAKIQLAGGKVTVQGLHKWKNGGEITEANLAALAKAYGTTPAYIRYGVTQRTMSDAEIAAAELVRSSPALAAEAFDFARYKLESLHNSDHVVIEHAKELIERIRKRAQLSTVNIRRLGRNSLRVVFFAFCINC